MHNRPNVKRKIKKRLKKKESFLRYCYSGLFPHDALPKREMNKKKNTLMKIRNNRHENQRMAASRAKKKKEKLEKEIKM